MRPFSVTTAEFGIKWWLTSSQLTLNELKLHLALLHDALHFIFCYFVYPQWSWKLGERRSPAKNGRGTPFTRVPPQFDHEYEASRGLSATAELLVNNSEWLHPDFNCTPLFHVESQKRYKIETYNAVLILTCTLPYSSRYDMKVIIVDQLTCNPKYVNFILLIELPIRRIPYQLHCKLCQLTRWTVS